MKLALLFVTVLGLQVAATSAHASSYREFGAESTEVLNVVAKDCTREFLAATSGSQTFVLKAEEIGGMTAEGFGKDVVLSIGEAYGAPIFKSEVTTKLTIRKIAYRSKQIPAPDAPTIWDTECLVENVKGAK